MLDSIQFSTLLSIAQYHAGKFTHIPSCNFHIGPKRWLLNKSGLLWLKWRPPKSNYLSQSEQVYLLEGYWGNPRSQEEP